MTGAGANQNTLGSRPVWCSPCGETQHGFASGQELCNDYNQVKDSDKGPLSSQEWGKISAF